ncbi:hypothetical protein EW146_g4404 [Bondarzewia mesenterica]|uniref:JmjC domain-containing protein n=1 Tax=Bondarzewia mesenterica TaxID=1095465 RepID=A0A4S4LUU2_9AGAM|nr:hypothetical protein EW146_g4404 [Bondarzewia mesenterica]
MAHEALGVVQMSDVSTSQLVHDTPGQAQITSIAPLPCPTDCLNWNSTILLEGREGFEWPKDYQTVEWWNGMTTILPFVNRMDGKPSEDNGAVREMAKYPGAWGNAVAPVEWVKLPDALIRHGGGLLKTQLQSKFGDDEERAIIQIRQALKMGKSVVVYPHWCPPAKGFDNAGVENLCGPLSQQVDWQDAHLREKARQQISQGLDDEDSDAIDISRTTTLGEFVKLADDPLTCGNLLDVPTFSPSEVPWFIGALSDDRFSWTVTKDAGFSSQKQHIGPANVPCDAWRMLNWVLVTMGGYVTFPHHDAEGLATFIGVRDGAKIWTIYAPKEDRLQRTDWLEYQTKIMSSGYGDFKYLQHTQGYNVLLTEGCYLLMPPGTWHSVYTPVKSLAVGGHFLTCECLSQTELARAFDKVHGEVATNTYHDGILPCLATLSWLWHLWCCIQPPIGGQTFGVRKTKETEEELQAAQRIIRAIMKANGISEDDIQSELKAIEWGRSDRGGGLYGSEISIVFYLSTFPVHICSRNNFPTAAGLASSASGFAALVSSLAALYALPSSPSELSLIARQGSGSACRSLFGGFVAWEQGTAPDGSDSLAVEVAPREHWPDIHALICIVSDDKKGTSSTSGMQRTVETSPLLQHRIKHVVPERMKAISKAILDKDFDTFARITMQDSNQFHAVALDTDPPFRTELGVACLEKDNVPHSRVFA